MGQRHANEHAARKRIAHIPGHANEFETAEEFGVSVRTLRKWRQLRAVRPGSRSAAKFITATNHGPHG